ncbi:MAG: aminotransferase class V-fold PLP-dependent enzyme [Gaiellales bacterium]
MTLGEARALFPVLEHVAYLNAGTFGPLARPVVAAMRRELDRDLGEGRAGMPYFLRLLELRDQVRETLGGLVGVTADHVALTSSTTDGCNIVCSGLGLGPGDEVVTTSDEHFGLLGPLWSTGARVVVVAPEPEAIEAAVTGRTRLIAISQVLWTTGRVLPVAELRERTGLPILVDGAQSVGAIPVDANDVDFLTISGQKWLCGPDSTGALVVAEPERLRVSAPSYFSQASYDAEGAFEPRQGAARFDPGWWSPAALSGMLAAVALRPDWWYDRAQAAAERCRELLAGAGLEVVVPDERATLVSFRPARGSTEEVVEHLRLAGVIVRDIPKTGLVRVSCGWWTDDSELDRLVEGLPA